MEQQKRLGAELSILDRLIDSDQSYISTYRSGLRRDLEDLLNTTLRARGALPYLEELEGSLVNFGIIDLFTVNLTTAADRERVLLNISKTIEKYEPRLMNIQISQIDEKETRSHLLRIKIIADTIIDESGEEIIFNSTVDVATGLIRTELIAR